MPRVPDDHDLAIAAFRHRFLAEALEAEGDAIVTILQVHADQPRTDPQGRSRAVSVRTLARWLAAYRGGGFLALCPKPRKDQGALRAITSEVFARAEALRREKAARPTKTIIDILVREKTAAPGAVARATLDRHLARRGLSRHTLRSLGQKTFRRIATTAPFELVVADFHHGPYVRTADGSLRRALLGAHIDHGLRPAPDLLRRQRELLPGHTLSRRLRRPRHPPRPLHALSERMPRCRGTIQPNGQGAIRDRGPRA